MDEKENIKDVVIFKHSDDIEILNCMKKEKIEMMEEIKVRTKKFAKSCFMIHITIRLLNFQREIKDIMKLNGCWMRREYLYKRIFTFYQNQLDETSIYYNNKPPNEDQIVVTKFAMELVLDTMDIYEDYLKVRRLIYKQIIYKWLFANIFLAEDMISSVCSYL